MAGVILLDTVTTFETVAGVFSALRVHTGPDCKLRLVSEDVVLTESTSSPMLSSTWTLVKENYEPAVHWCDDF
jgi:hypothetical protein